MRQGIYAKGDALLFRGFALWLTGLSGSGKTTLGDLLLEEIKKRGLRVERLDGDNLRDQIGHGLGFSKHDREENIKRAAYIAKLLTRNDVIVVASFISPYREMRNYCRREIGAFIEVFVKCSVEELIKRDVKGYYKKAISGEISNFTGISDPYEEPETPELIVVTDKQTTGQCISKIIEYLEKHGFLPCQK